MSAKTNKDQAIHAVMDTMASVQRSSQAFIEKITSPESLTQNQIMLLFQLQLTGSLNITDIAERFIITPGAASFMCNKLEDDGLIERVRTKEDRRVVHIVITTQGEQRVRQLFDRFDKEELDRIALTLQKVHELMKGIVD
ncbi:MarR family winged helix-turn-helix transcriptional regulator [Paenibacillus sp. GCM10012306]|uniref:MarR family winged helix-turn-helix transcriptional regulator n=1 Tax=Paenibacillus sp. GCM10012306 TaxID=3317342 RepID=UPI0036236090